MITRRELNDLRKALRIVVRLAAKIDAPKPKRRRKAAAPAEEGIETIDGRLEGDVHQYGAAARPASTADLVQVGDDEILEHVFEEAARRCGCGESA
jgi:hypothetical protein